MTASMRFALSSCVVTLQRATDIAMELPYLHDETIPLVRSLHYPLCTKLPYSKNIPLTAKKQKKFPVNFL